MSGLTPHSDEIDFTGGLKNISFFYLVHVDP